MSLQEKKESPQKTSLILIFSIFLIGFFGGASVITYLYIDTVRTYKLSKQQEKKAMPTFNILTELIQKEYVEPINSSELEKKTIKGLINELDPHSKYLEGYEKSEFTSKFDSQIGMVGMSLRVENKKIIVIGLVPNSPAQKIGIIKGDVIKKIENEQISENLEKEIVKIRGKIGTNLALTIERNGVDIPFKIIREHIEIPSITSKIIEFKEKSILYLKIDSFLEHTFKEMVASIIKHEKKELHGVIVDVRNNPGGLLNSSVEISNLFLNDGNTVVHIANKNSQETLTTSPYYWGETALVTLHNTKFASEYNIAKTIISKLPMAVIINEESASAAEIFAGAIQDNKRGIIVGKKSYGKGTVQQMFSLKNGDMFKLTTSRFYTPKGISIQGKGIIPDVKIPDTNNINNRESTLDNTLKNNGDLKVLFIDDNIYQDFKYNSKLKYHPFKKNDYITYAIETLLLNTQYINICCYSFNN